MKRVASLAMAAVLAVITAACSSPEEPAQPATQPTQPPQAAAGVPAGYAPDDFYALFGSAEAPEPAAVTPPQCAPLAFDTVTLVEWGAIPPGDKPVEMFSSEAGATAFTREDSALAGFDPTGCDTFTRENETSLGTTLTTYTTSPLEAAVAGADRAQGFTQTVTGVTLDGADVGAAKAGEETTILIVEAGGTAYIVAGVDGATVADLEALAQDRVARS